MRTKTLPNRVRGLGVAVCVTAAAGVVGIAGAGSAAATEHSLKLDYRCPLPMLGDQMMQLTLNADIPEPVPPGNPIPRATVDAEMALTGWTGLNGIGAASMSGTASLSSTLHVQQGDLSIRAPLTLEKAVVPDDPAPIVLHGKGQFPPFSISGDKPWRITVDDMQIVPELWDSGGNVIEIPDESGISLKMDCTRSNAAQSNVLAESGIPDRDNMPPTAPGDVAATADSNGAAKVAWAASTDQAPFGVEPSGVAGYEVFDQTGKSYGKTDGKTTSLSLTDLLPGDYTFAVNAVDGEGNASAPGTAAPVTVKGDDTGSHVKYGFALAGSTFVKAPNGKAPLTGAIDADLDLKTKAYTADLSLNKKTGNFSILGFLPVTAGIEIVPQDKVTGTLNGPLEADVDVVTKLSTFNLFGIPLGGGDKCQTKEPSAIHLESAGTFNPLKGGEITGTYKLSEIQDCGVLTPILSAFTAGDGNTLDLNLTPDVQN